MWLVFSLFAFADDVAEEEVIVWEQPFARFDDKRWLVKSEVVTPALTPLGSMRHTVRTRAWQLEAIIHCTLNDERGRLRETDCRIEESALRVHAPAVKPGNGFERAIQGMTDDLESATLQLQVHQRGTVPNTGLDGMPSNYAEQRRLANGARTLMTQVAGAFHTDFPSTDPRGAQWTSKKEPLMAVASPMPGMSRALVDHRLDVVDGLWVQQSSGRATSTMPVPNPKAALACFHSVPGVEPAGTPPAQKPTTTDIPPSKHDKPTRFSPNTATTDCAPNTSAEPEFLADVELIYSTHLSGVTVVDPGRGYPIERVWAVTGEPTASSPGSSSGMSYWSAGSLRELAPDEVVELGPSGAVGPPGGETVEGLPQWVPVVDR